MLAFYLSLIDDADDRALFENIYYSHRKQMMTVALSVLNNEYDAEDAVHDVFCIIAEKHIHILHNIKDERDIKNYLLKAIKNTALNFKRKESSDARLKEKIIYFNDETVLSDDKFLEFICGDISYRKLVDSIKSLDPKYSEVLYFHYILELKTDEISDLLGRNAQTVKKQISRGKSLLIEKLGTSEVSG